MKIIGSVPNANERLTEQLLDFKYNADTYLHCGDRHTIDFPKQRYSIRQGEENRACSRCLLSDASCMFSKQNRTQRDNLR